MDKIIVVLVGLVGVVALVVIMGLLFAFPTMWLWNGCLVGLIDGVHPIDSVWTAFGINVLFGLLFKNNSSK